MLRDGQQGGAVNFIDEEAIFSEMEQARQPDPTEVREVVAKAKETNGLTPCEAAAPLNAEDEELHREILAAACEVKKKIYGNRLVLFAPLYVTNECRNQCALLRL